MGHERELLKDVNEVKLRVGFMYFLSSVVYLLQHQITRNSTSVNSWRINEEQKKERTKLRRRIVSSQSPGRSNSLSLVHTPRLLVVRPSKLRGKSYLYIYIERERA